MAKSLGPAPAGNAFIEIDASAFDRAALAFGTHWDAEASQMVEDAMQRGAEVEQRAIKKQARPHRRSGRMDAQIKIVRPTGSGFGQTIRVRAGGPIAHLVAGNVRGHAIPMHGIHPIHAMPLYTRLGVEGFAESAKHPPTRGDPFFSRGVKNARLAVNNVFAAALRRLAERLALIMKGAA